MLEDALEQHAELGHRRRRVGRALDRPPGLEPLLARAERADPGRGPVGGDEDGVRTRRAPGSGPGRSASWWYAVQIVACSSAGFLSSMTASGRPLTNSTTSGRRSCPPSTTVNWLTASQSLASGSLEVDDLRLRAGDRAVGPAVLHRHAVHEHPVERPVALDERRPGHAGSACGTRRRRPRPAARG